MKNKGKIKIKRKVKEISGERKIQSCNISENKKIRKAKTIEN